VLLLPVVKGRATRRARAHGRGKGQQGFTLAEVVIAVAILGLIAGALGAAFVTTGRSSIGVSARYGQSHDEQIASAYLATDVQSNWTLTDTVCGTGGATVINFGSADGSIATYAYGPSAGENRLTRRYCSGASVVSDVVLVHNGGGNPAVTCEGGACSTGLTPQPNKVVISIPVHANGVPDNVFSLSGSRRACINSVTGTTPTTAPCGGNPATLAPVAPYGLLAFGGGTVQIQGNNSILEVRGPMIVDSTAATAVDIGGNGTNRRITVFSDATRSSTGTFAIRSPGGCRGCSGTTVSPMPSSYINSITDPFAGIPYPDESGLPVYADGQYHGPGVYTTVLTVTTDTTFASGVYILEAGMHVSGGTMDAQSGVLFFNGCGLNSPRCAAGSGGILAVDGQSTANITPAQSGPYQLLAIWQPRQNTSGMTMAGQTSTSVLRGIVYAPGSTGLSIGSGNNTVLIQIWSVAGTAITLGGNASAIIGQ
jgi:prepilin-type N-terminal cleavage/methylation domain-containing protein